VARDKRASFAAQPYWGRPIAGWGAPTAGVGEARIVIVGLAPAANGGNRTGRVFTGDSSGDWLFASLFRVGLATQERSEHAGDGQALVQARMVATVRCAPPANKPTPGERDTCRPFLERELALLGDARAVVVLGGWGWQALLPVLDAGWVVPRPRPAFGHGVHVTLEPRDDRLPLQVFGCYHVSQQNTFTGRLTPAMLEAVLLRAAGAAGLTQ
jgi:uracil-DNA glycosylase family 4